MGGRRSYHLGNKRYTIIYVPAYGRLAVHIVADRRHTASLIFEAYSEYQDLVIENGTMVLWSWRSILPA